MTRVGGAKNDKADELETLAQHCQPLRLTRVGRLLVTLLEQAAQQELSYRAVLTTVLATEVAANQEKHHTLRVEMARFPFQKSLDGFDWNAQPSIDPKVIKELATMRFVADGANALLLRSAWGRENASERRPRPGGVSPRPARDVYYGDGTDHHAR